MYFSSLLVGVTAVAAWPQSQPRDTANEWIPANPTDSRAPCPMMNTLANHGYISRDGRNVSAEDIATGLEKAINYKHDDSLFLIQNAIGLLGNPATIDLEDLNAHNITEHVASLTRLDSPGDTLHVNQGLLQAVLADSEDDFITVASLAKSRTRVEATSPPLSGGFINQALGEAAFLVQMLSDSPIPSDSTSDDYAKLQAPKAWIALWLGDEKLPHELGWQKPSNPLLLADTFGLGGAIGALQE